MVEAEGAPEATSAGDGCTRYGGRLSSSSSSSSLSATGTVRITGAPASTPRSSKSSRKSPMALLASESISPGSPPRSSSRVVAVSEATAPSPPFGSSDRRAPGVRFPSPRPRGRSASFRSASFRSSSSLPRFASATARADSLSGGFQSGPAAAVTNTYPPAADICAPSCACSLAVTAAALLLRASPPEGSSPNVSRSTDGSRPTDRSEFTSASRSPRRRSPHATTTLPPGARCAATASGSAAQCSGR
mmetsp:Transcript_702/g.2669  ORF Transcript_702/g.2669 Transcript_702/m.2669 type:complete len:247 (-) Transcript_702:462-1202(-)